MQQRTDPCLKDLSTSLFDTEEIREKRKRSAQRSRSVARRLLQLKRHGLTIEEIMEILGREFPPGTVP